MRLKYALAKPERSDAMPALLTGGCLCGAIRYTVNAPVATLRACHCTNCQKSSGAAGTVNAVVPSASFRITKGATRKYDDSATHSGRTLSRHFCADCGSPIYSQRNPDPGF
ncbi:MAG: GFA family protein, partial [Betaproteobacteria bacterium]